MTRSFNFNSDASRFVANRPARLERAVARRNAFRIVDASGRTSPSQVDAGRRGGTPDLDALMVAFVLRSQPSMSIAELAARLTYDEGRIERAVDLLLEKGTIDCVPNPIASLTTARLT